MKDGLMRPRSDGLKRMAFWSLGMLLLAASAPARSQTVSALLSDGSHPEIYYTVDGKGEAAKFQQGTDAPLWTRSYPEVKAASGGFSAALSAEFQLLAYCTRRPVAGWIQLRLVHLESGAVLVDIPINKDAGGQLLASCHDLQFIEREKILVFNDVHKTHRVSLRLAKLTHTYVGADRHQSSAVPADGRTLVGLSNVVSTWDFRSGRLLQQHGIYIPGFPRYAAWDIDSAIAPDGKLGFVIASDDQERTALVWVAMNSGHIRRLYQFAEKAKVAKVQFVDDTHVVAIVNNHAVKWNFAEANPTIIDIPGFRDLELQWDGHEDVAINVVINDPDNIPDLEPPYPPEYTDVMTPHAYPLALLRSGQQVVGFFLRQGAPKIEFLRLE